MGDRTESWYGVLRARLARLAGAIAAAIGGSPEQDRLAWLASFPAQNPVPIAEVDSTGRVRYANPAAERAFPGLAAAGAAHPWLVGWSEVVRLFRESGAPSYERIVVVGRTTYAQRMYWVPETECIRIYGADVTRRAGAEAALRDSESRFRALADSMPQLAWTARPDGHVTWYNHRWYEYTGTTPEQVEGWGWQLVHEPGALPEILRRWRESLSTGITFEMESPLRGVDGGYRRFLTRVLPLRDSEGEVLQWFGTSTDVTDLVEAEESLREASRRKDEFLGMLSHELRNPLAPIRNSIYLVRHAKDAAQAARALDVIARQTEHLTRIVDDLLDVTRIARGKIELHRSRVDLRELVAHAGDDLRPVMAERGVAFRTELPPEPVWADADATRVAQVVGNLLHNAAKFSRRGGEATLSLRALGAEAEISVTDTGVGIAPKLLAQVFEPFVQGERTLARTEGGLGLGLAVVKAVAELHGGSVRAESAGEGRGATFVVRLPTSASGAAQPVAPAAGSTERAARPRRILVVDDNRDAAETLALIVTMLGHEAAVAFDGPAALEQLRRDPFDTVLCDIGLPGMSGYEVARALRASHGADLRLIAVSGYARPEDVQEAAASGFDGHVRKPCDLAEIERMLG
jgi:PAS domain S-box-containing protein